MRIIKELLLKDCKITFYHWNGKYIIKIEQDNLEQTYKISDFDLSGEDILNNLLDEEFMTKVIRGFESMQVSLADVLHRNE